MPLKAHFEKSVKSKRAQALARRRGRAQQTELDKKRERIKAQQKWAAAPGAIEELCMFVAEGGTLLHYSNASAGVLSYSFLYAWVHADEPRKAAYKEAQQARYEAAIDAAMELADRVKEERQAIDKAKLQVATRQWLASRLVPKYNDKIEVTAKAQPLAEKSDDDLDHELAELRRRLEGPGGD